MNNEIKEILDNFKDYELRYKQCNENQFIIFYRDIHLILDYITNLQEENERLREVVENLTTMTVCGDRKQIKNTAQFKLDQLQLRINKAIYWINEYCIKECEEGDIKAELRNVEDILKGEDK